MGGKRCRLQVFFPSRQLTLSMHGTQRLSGTSFRSTKSIMALSRRSRNPTNRPEVWRGDVIVDCVKIAMIRHVQRVETKAHVVRLAIAGT